MQNGESGFKLGLPSHRAAPSSRAGRRAPPRASPDSPPAPPAPPVSAGCRRLLPPSSFPEAAEQRAPGAQRIPGGQDETKAGGEWKGGDVHRDRTAQGKEEEEESPSWRGLPAPGRPQQVAASWGVGTRCPHGDSICLLWESEWELPRATIPASSQR